MIKTLNFDIAASPTGGLDVNDHHDTWGAVGAFGEVKRKGVAHGQSGKGDTTRLCLWRRICRMYREVPQVPSHRC